MFKKLWAIIILRDFRFRRKVKAARLQLLQAMAVHELLSNGWPQTDIAIALNLKLGRKVMRQLAIEDEQVRIARMGQAKRPISVTPDADISDFCGDCDHCLDDTGEHQVIFDAEEAN